MHQDPLQMVVSCLGGGEQNFRVFLSSEASLQTLIFLVKRKTFLELVHPPSCCAPSQRPGCLAAYDQTRVLRVACNYLPHCAGNGCQARR